MRAPARHLVWRGFLLSHHMKGVIMTTNCTHEVLPLTAPIAVRCEDCGQLMPYVPEPAGEPIVLTGTSAMFKSDYDKLLATRAAERMARKSDACWEHRSAQHDCPNCL